LRRLWVNLKLCVVVQMWVMPSLLYALAYAPTALTRDALENVYAMVTRRKSAVL
jgi:hypothetical protein